jgi:hypothetical protein
MIGPLDHRIIGPSGTNSVLLRRVDRPMSRFSTIDKHKSGAGWNLPSLLELTADSPQLVVNYFHRSALRLLPTAFRLP